MKTRMVEQRIGEYLGPVDWSYEFASHFKTCCSSDEQRSECCGKAVANLRKLAESPDAFEATTDGGWPRFGWQRVLEVGMYDGWPYWRPVPSVLLSGVLSPQWHSFDSITDIAALEAAR